MLKPKHSLFLATLLLPAVYLGCSSSEYELGVVRGQIVLDGKPAGGVIISFSPGNGVRSSGGQADKDGNYQLIFNQHHAGALVGVHQVSFIAEGGLGKKLAKTGKPIRMVLEGVEVKAGENVIDLELRNFQPAT